MAKEVQSQQNQQQQQAQQQTAVLSTKKILMIGVPLFLIQVVVVYFIVVKLFGNSAGSSGTPQQAVEQQVPSASTSKVFVVKDMIVNPAGTGGNRYLLVTVGLEVNTSKAYDEFQQKEVQVHDVLNTLFASKSLYELIDVSKREALRKEIAQKTSALLTSGTVTNVYFSKYIIQ